MTLLDGVNRQRRSSPPPVDQEEAPLQRLFIAFICLPHQSIKELHLSLFFVYAAEAQMTPFILAGVAAAAERKLLKPPL